VNEIHLPEDVVAKCDATDQFQNFDRGIRLFLSVPKSAVLKDEAKTKRKRSTRQEINSRR
jgi:hypothetical protein